MCKVVAPWHFRISYFIFHSETNYILDMQNQEINFLNSLIFFRNLHTQNLCWFFNTPT